MAHRIGNGPCHRAFQRRPAGVDDELEDVLVVMAWINEHSDAIVEPDLFVVVVKRLGPNLVYLRIEALERNVKRTFHLNDLDVRLMPRGTARSRNLSRTFKPSVGKLKITQRLDSLPAGVVNPAIHDGRLWNLVAKGDLDGILLRPGVHQREIGLLGAGRPAHEDCGHQTAAHRLYLSENIAEELIVYLGDLYGSVFPPLWIILRDCARR